MRLSVANTLASFTCTQVNYNTNIETSSFAYFEKEFTKKINFQEELKGKDTRVE